MGGGGLRSWEALGGFWVWGSAGLGGGFLGFGVQKGSRRLPSVQGGEGGWRGGLFHPLSFPPPRQVLHR